MTDAQKQFILDRFFDTNRRIVARFPRYQELLDLRDNSDAPLTAYSADDFRDLQLLFNLAWTDPDWLAEEPLASLVEKGEGFSEEDKTLVLDEHLRLVNEVIPLHRELQDAGQIEITTTPFAHPILPLLVNTDLALKALPEATLPNPPFIWGQDAVAQVELGVAYYTERFGQPPRGMWPVSYTHLDVYKRQPWSWPAACRPWAATSSTSLPVAFGMHRRSRWRRCTTCRLPKPSSRRWASRWSRWA